MREDSGDRPTDYSGTFFAYEKSNVLVELCMKNVVSAIALGLFILLPLSGQVSLDEAGMSIEELYLQGSASIASMSSMIISNEYETQLAGMRALRRAVSEGRIDPATDEYVQLMGIILEQGVTTVSRNWSSLPDSYHPMLRR
jgi:hypothetical protein